MSDIDQFSRLPAGSPLDDLILTPDVIQELLDAATTPDEQGLVLQWIEETLPFTSPARFAQKCDPDFLLPPHIEYLDHVLEDLVCGRLGYNRLIVTMPPRHGKSYLMSEYLPAWFLARYPDRRVILTSYEADFASGWGRKARDHIEQNPWCGITVRGDSKAAKNWNIAGHRGGMQTAGSGGPVTGKGAHLFIIDDPLKNAEEAQSQVRRQAVWDWYISTAKTRLEPGAFQIVIMTRWHEDDLVGKLLASQPGQWMVVNFPAIAEEEDEIGRKPGDALWPGAYPLPVLEEIRDTPETSYWWGALYQQHPTTEEGGMFSRPDFRYWELSADGSAYVLDGGTVVCPVKNTIRFQTVDLAASKRTKADYTVIATWAITKTEPARLLLIDRYRGRIEAPDHLPKIEELFYLHSRGVPKVRFVGVGKQTFGLAVLQEAARKGDHWLRGEQEDHDKYSRAIPASQLVKSHIAHWPRRAPWLEEWERELLQFDNGAHDDQVDTFSLAALEFGKRRRWAPKTAIPEREDPEAQIVKKLAQRKRQAARQSDIGGARHLHLRSYRHG